MKKIIGVQKNPTKVRGLKKGLRILAKVKGEVGVPVLSDIHRMEDVDSAKEVLDILQSSCLSLPADKPSSEGGRSRETGQYQKGTVSRSGKHGRGSQKDPQHREIVRSS